MHPREGSSFRKRNILSRISNLWLSLGDDLRGCGDVAHRTLVPPTALVAQPVPLACVPATVSLVVPGRAVELPVVRTLHFLAG